MNGETESQPRTGRLSVIPSRAIFDRRLSPVNLVVLGALCSYTNRDGECFPSQRTLATLLGMSRRTVSRSIHILTDLGYLKVSNRTRENGSTTTNLYTILYEVEVPKAIWDDEIESQPDSSADMLQMTDEQPKKTVKKKTVKKKAVKEEPAKEEQIVLGSTVPGPWQVGRALAKVCRMDFEANKNQLTSEGKKLAAMEGFSLEKLDFLFRRPDGLWYQHDWRGKRNQYPTPAQVRQTWAALEEKLSVDPSCTIVGGEEGWIYV